MCVYIYMHREREEGEIQRKTVREIEQEIDREREK